ncbi:HD domain-containing phosphohydrolase [Endothiovibrio diazotrophicus]
MSASERVFDVSGSTILVVDDEPINLEMLERMLVSGGYREVVTTEDPREVEPLVEQHRPDLLLLDLTMPYRDGFQVIEALKARYPGPCDLPPILVLATQQGEEFRHRALEMGARDYVTKPFDRIELLMRVRNLLEVRNSIKVLRDEKRVLESMVVERTREIHDTRLQVVRRLGLAAEYRDNETGMHIVRMSKISELLGRALGMQEEALDLLLNASPMHDIGKIGIPDHVLLKPGKLDEHEFELVKTHAIIGADILSGDDSELMTMAREIALTHHERWDGTGYPHGLQGEEIPLVGRICAVADVFDALTSTRPYKQGWLREDAVEYLRSGAGSQFDPTVVDAFMGRLDEVYAICDEYQDSTGIDDDLLALAEESL